LRRILGWLSATDKLAIVSWNQVCFIPRVGSRTTLVLSKLKIPEGWKYATSLNHGECGGE